MPVRDPARVREAEAINRRLVTILRGDPNAAALTQCLRVPGTYQFKDPARPFLCRLLNDYASTIPPYDLDRVRAILDAREVFLEGSGAKEQGSLPPTHAETPKTGWREVLNGVPAGQRNTAAAVVVGSILCRLPEEFWDTAAWGGLKEWNAKNEEPLPACELRSVFESIARRERKQRWRKGRPRQPKADRGAEFPAKAAHQERTMSIDVTISGTGTGTCSLTGKEGEGLTVAFKDGTVSGFLSTKAFMQLLRMKAGEGHKKPVSIPDAAPVNGALTPK